MSAPRAPRARQTPSLSLTHAHPLNSKPSGCQQYHTTLQTDNWMHLSHLLNAATHGHIHETIGGAWDNFYPDFLNGTVSPAVYTFAHSIQPLARILWRNDLLECPAQCDMGTDPSDCMCACNEEKMAGRPAYEILDSTGILASGEGGLRGGPGQHLGWGSGARQVECLGCC